MMSGGDEQRDGGRARRGSSDGGRRWRRSVPIAFLLTSLGVAGFGGLEAFRAQRSHQETAAALLEDYSEFAAWSYERTSWDVLRQAIDGHLSLAYANTTFARGLATEQCLLLILAPGDPSKGCPCGAPLAGEYSFFTRVGEPVSESQWAGERPGSMHQTIVVDAVQRHARDAYGDGWPFAMLHVAGLGDDTPIIAYTLLESPMRVADDFASVRDTVLYGFQVDPRLLADVYASVLTDRILLPPALTADRPNDEVIGVQVVGPDGSVLYESAPGTEMAFAAPVEREAIFGGGEIRASVLPDVAGELIIGGLPRDRTGVLALIFSLAGALAVLAILQLRREDQLALLRQDFVASVSHELRTPLAQVRLFTETLRLGRTRNDDQREWALDSIDRETRRLSNLVENILHFSRAERGVQRLDREPADLAVEVREAIVSFRPLLPERKGRIVAEVPDGLVAEIHRDSIRQVVLNLLDNAVRYGREGQTIRVGGARTAEAVRIDVDDEGIGVPLDERDRIFEPFRRGERAVGTVVVGSGIGLAVVSEILEAHDGRVWVEDAPGGGARFSFELPALHTALATHFDDSGPVSGSAAGVA
jgi:signal transduction histidine kinase